jgi:hypothetical protein
MPTYSEHIRMTLLDSNQSQPDVTANAMSVRLERSIHRELAVAMADANQTLTDEQADTNGVFTCTGALTAQRNLIVPTRQKRSVVINSTSGGYGVQVKTASGTGVVVAAGDVATVYSDGTNVIALSGASSGGAVTSVFGRTGAVVAEADDYAIADITGLQAALDALKIYDVPLAFKGGPPTSSEVIGGSIIVRTVTFAANFSGSSGYIGTNPTGSFVISVKDDGSEIGTITISTLGAFTFATTSGTSKIVAAGSRLEFVAPASADATAAYILATLAGTI